MSSQISSLNGDGTKKGNLFRKQNAVNTPTDSKTSSGMSGGKGSGVRHNPTTQNKKSIGSYKLGTTMHAPGTVPEYLKSK